MLQSGLLGAALCCGIVRREQRVDPSGAKHHNRRQQRRREQLKSELHGTPITMVRLARRALLVDSAANHGRVEPLAIRGLRLDLLGHWIGELVILPERALRLCQFDPFPDKRLTVDVLQVDQILPTILSLAP